MTGPTDRVCLRCGFTSAGSAPFCRRCGLPFGAAPVVAEGDWPPECPVCYAVVGRDGRFPDGHGGRTTYEHHAYDHELRPVGDDEWLETLRDGDEIRIGAWRAPFGLTRRYVVTGQWEGGRAREYAHNAVILAMVGASRAAAAEAAGSGPVVAPDTGTKDQAGKGRFGFRRRADGDAAAGRSPEAGDPRAPSVGDLATARHAVEDLRERYLRGSRR